MSVVLAGIGPDHAGPASAVLSTVQQVGNALGVAVTGIVFFGAVGEGYQHAFALGAAQLAAVGVLGALSTRLLPKRAAPLASTAVGGARPRPRQPRHDTPPTL